MKYTKVNGNILYIGRYCASLKNTDSCTFREISISKDILRPIPARQRGLLEVKPSVPVQIAYVAGQLPMHLNTATESRRITVVKRSCSLYSYMFIAYSCVSIHIFLCFCLRALSAHSGDGSSACNAKCHIVCPPVFHFNNLYDMGCVFQHHTVLMHIYL